MTLPKSTGRDPLGPRSAWPAILVALTTLELLADVRYTRHVKDFRKLDVWQAVVDLAASVYVEPRERNCRLS
jgi:hypothetical protein